MLSQVARTIGESLRVRRPQDFAFALPAGADIIAGQIAEHLSSFLLDHLRALDFRFEEIELVRKRFSDRKAFVRRGPGDDLATEESFGGLGKVAWQINLRGSRKAVTHDRVPNRHPEGQRLRVQELCEFLISDQMINCRRHSRIRLRRGTSDVFRHRKELLQRPCITLRGTLSDPGIIEPKSARDFVYLRKPGGIFFIPGQILFGEGQAGWTVGISAVDLSACAGAAIDNVRTTRPNDSSLIKNIGG